MNTQATQHGESAKVVTARTLPATTAAISALGAQNGPALYQFKVESAAGRVGKFVRTNAGESMLLAMNDRLTLRLTPASWSAEDRAWLEDLANTYPAFLEGQAKLVDGLIWAGDDKRAYAVVVAAVREAGKLMPFRARQWSLVGWITVYAQLLSQQMMLESRRGNTEAALRIAHWLLALDPYDTFSVKVALPLIEMRMGRVAQAEVALADSHAELETTTWASSSFVAFAVGRQADFTRLLGLAVMHRPWIAGVLTGAKDVIAHEEEFDDIGPELRVWAEFATPLMVKMPELAEAVRKFLRRRLVKEGQALLGQFWRDYRQDPQGHGEAALVNLQERTHAYAERFTRRPVNAVKPKV